jgi:hypothetical protein
MKPCHGTALTLVVWYLMVPPVDSNRDVDLTAPVDQWHVLEAFDAAESCKDQQSLYREVMQTMEKDLKKGMKSWKQLSEKDKDKLLDKTVPEFYELRKLKGYGFDSARCIATDDPRLKKK